MKILFTSIALLFIFSSNLQATYVFACLCSDSLSSAYDGIESHIVDDNLEEIDNNIDDVTSSLEENIDAVEKNIESITESNNSLKLEIAKLHEYNQLLIKHKHITNEKFSISTSASEIKTK